MGNITRRLIDIYLIIGSLVACISFFSAVAYYGFGPGAIWEIGILPSLLGAGSAVFYALLRIAVWPYGIYQVATGEATFFGWLFYLWHMPTPA